MTEILEKMRVLLSPILEEHGAFLAELLIRSERGGRLIQVFVDTDKGISIEECASVSRLFAHELDRGDLIQGSYRLEVSSPGIDKPLRMLRQYHKNIGRRFKVLYQSVESPVTIVGTLLSVGEDTLTFETEAGSTTTLEFTKIIESKEELPW